MSNIDLYKGENLEFSYWNPSIIYSDGDVFKYQDQLFQIKIDEKDKSRNISGVYVFQEDIIRAKNRIELLRKTV